MYTSHSVVYWWQHSLHTYTVIVCTNIAAAVSATISHTLLVHCHGFQFHFRLLSITATCSILQNQRWFPFLDFALMGFVLVVLTMTCVIILISCLINTVRCVGYRQRDDMCVISVHVECVVCVGWPRCWHPPVSLHHNDKYIPTHKACTRSWTCHSDQQHPLTSKVLLMRPIQVRHSTCERLG